MLQKVGRMAREARACVCVRRGGGYISSCKRVIGMTTYLYLSSETLPPYAPMGFEAASVYVVSTYDYPACKCVRARVVSARPSLIFTRYCTQQEE